MKRRRGFGLLMLVFIVLAAVCGGWLRTQRQQYAHNRALINALTRNDTKTALALVNAGADPNTRFAPTTAPSIPLLLNQLLHHKPPPANDSATALIFACGSPQFTTFDGSAQWVSLEENLPLLQAMLAHGADVHARELQGRTILYEPILQWRVHTMELLLQHGADVNAQDDLGTTPMMLASAQASPKSVHLLLSHGANLKIQNGNGSTALHWAVTSPFAASIIPDLLAHGADSNLRDKMGITPFKSAQLLKRPDVARLLKRN